MKVCDVTQFYSPHSGGVRRYVTEKVRWMRRVRPGDEHVLIVPGAEDGCVGDETARIHTVASPCISRTTGYRVLLRTEQVERVLECENPDVVECGDPYQVGWRVARAARDLGIPAVAFYHSHFPEAYLRPFGGALGRWAERAAQTYVRELYRRFALTLAPSPALVETLREWGVPDVEHLDLGVDTSVFQPIGPRQPRTDDRTLLLYVGRLAVEKNTHTLFEAVRLLETRQPGRFHLVVLGEGLQRAELATAVAAGAPITHRPELTTPEVLAAWYRSADALVHPGLLETFGLTTIEAQSCGLPVVGFLGTRMNRIVLHDQSAWATERTATGLADAVERAVNLPRPDVVKLHGEIAARFSWDAVFARLWEHYRGCVGAGKISDTAFSR